MNALSTANTLVVSQKKEWGEILSGFETRNRYVVLSEQGNELYYAAEKSSFLLRWFLKALRPFTIVVARAGGAVADSSSQPQAGKSAEGRPALYLERPFRFYFHKMDVRDTQGKLLGTIEREFSLLRRLYRVSNAMGMEIFRLYGPLLHPWTFEIREHDQEVGKISKKWSGLLKEGFTDADNFAVALPPGKDVETKSVLLGAVFLIDFVHFERR